MNSEVIHESDYLQIEPYHAYMRMQVGNERTRPFLVRMKPPGPALYRDFIAEIKAAYYFRSDGDRRKDISTNKL